MLQMENDNGIRDIIIRRAQYHDLSVMAKLLEELFAIESDFKIDHAKQYAGLRRLYEKRQCDLLVAKHRNTVVGMVTMQPLVSTAEGGVIGVVEDLIVTTSMRGKGIGRRLLSEMASIAKEREYHRIQLAYDHRNEQAVDFYTKFGFEMTHFGLFHLHGLADG